MKKALYVLALFAVLLLATARQVPEQPFVAAMPINLTLQLKEMVGVNGVVNNNPFELAQTVGWVRDYHKWYWYEATRGVYTWSTGKQQLDRFYSTLHSLGVKVMPDVEFAPGWASSDGKMDGIPDAAAHARYMGALVSHYGKTIAAIENYNEPSQRWQPIRFPPKVFGAMTAGDYAAVKASNPNMLFVLAGVPWPGAAYLDGAVQAAEGKFDVVNIHWYAIGDPTEGGKNPESGDLLSTIDEAKAWRDANAPGKPIWITEFGWDTYMQPDGRKSKVYAPEPYAANYLLRALFIMQGRGIEKGFVFMYRDPGETTADLHEPYSSAGLVANDSEKDGRKKPGWYYLSTLKNVLGEYTFDRIVADGPNLFHYEYVLPGTRQRAAVLWARDGDRDNGYAASYHGPAGSLVIPTDGSTIGTVSTTDGNLILTERPVFVLYTSEAESDTSAMPIEQNSGVQPPALPVPTSTPIAMPTPVAPRELLSNGGFEDDVDGDDIPDGWQVSLDEPDLVSRSANQHQEGSFSLLAHAAPDKSLVLYQDVPIKPGESYEFSGWMRVPSNSGWFRASVQLVALSSTGRVIVTTTALSQTAATPQWVEFQMTQPAPQDAATLRVQLKVEVLRADVYVDGLSLIGIN